MTRIDINSVEPKAYQAMLGLEQYLHQSGLNKNLLNLIKMRASQINGCAFCLNMHSQAARKAGETEQRLYTLSAWRETKLFSLPEKAALAFTEAVTLISDHPISDRLYQEVSHYFSANEIAQILMAICTINVWNRLAIATELEIEAN